MCFFFWKRRKEGRREERTAPFSFFVDIDTIDSDQRALTVIKVKSNEINLKLKIQIQIQIHNIFFISHFSFSS